MPCGVVIVAQFMAPLMLPTTGELRTGVLPPREYGADMARSGPAGTCRQAFTVAIVTFWRTSLPIDARLPVTG